jgi:hypothetical protein
LISAEVARSRAEKRARRALHQAVDSYEYVVFGQK